MNNSCVFTQEKETRKFPFGAIIVIAAQLIALGGLIAQKIIDANSTMNFMGTFGTWTYVGTDFWMEMLLLLAIAVLSIIDKYKLLKVILICELGIAAFVNFVYMLVLAMQTADMPYYTGYTDAAIWNFGYLILIATVALLTLRDFGVSAIKISNKIILIVSCVFAIFCLYGGSVLFINACAQIEFGQQIYSALSNLSSVLTSVGLFLIGERIANPYKRVKRAKDAFDNKNNAEEA